MQVKELICPNDPYMANSAITGQALLSYGVNDGFFVSYPQSGPPTDRNGNVVSPTILSKLTSRPNTAFPRGENISSQTTIMLGERTGIENEAQSLAYQRWWGIAGTYSNSGLPECGELPAKHGVRTRAVDQQ